MTVIKHMKTKILALAMLCLLSIGSFAQSDLITGKVTDRWGEPVSGALISLVSNPEVRVSTDAYGNFAIGAAVGDQLAIVTRELETTRAEVVDQNDLEVVIDYASKPVNLGFGISQRMAESTGSVSTTSSEEINRSSALSLSNSLYGNALGLTSMQNGGAVWEDYADFSIRGLKTLSNNNVLVLVDGFERSIGTLSREEVESVSILKDAAAVALYGFRGINGVVSVTTKRGRYNSMDIDVSYDHAFTTPLRLPDFANGYTYASAYNEALENDGQPAKYNSYEMDAFQDGTAPFLYPNVDWVNETLKDKGYSNIYNVGIRGGGSKMRYYTLLNLEGNDGFIKNTETNDGYSTQMKYSKANIRTNLDVDLSEKTKAEVNLLGIIAEHNRPGRIHGTLMDNLYTLPSAAYPIKTYDGIWGGNETWTTTNPVAGVQNTGYARSHARSLFADVKLTQDLDLITDGLSGSFRIGYDNYAEFWEGKTRGYQYASDRLGFNNGIPVDTIRTAGGESSDLSFSRSLGTQNRHFNFAANLDYETSFTNSELFTSLIYSQERIVYNGQHNTYNRQNLAGYAHYTMHNKYIADLTLVVSGSNRLAPNHKYGFSPTLSAAWVISNESFMQGVSAVDFLKLRASAGMINSDYIPAVNLWEQSYDGGSSYPFTDGFNSYGGIREGRLPTRDFKLERAFKYNLGLDAVLYKGLTITADGYFERRSNIFVPESGQNSAVLGASSAYVNAGIVDSRGIEIGIDYEKIKGDLSYFVGAKYTLAKNEIVEQLEAPRAYDYLKTTGQPVNQLFGLQAIGFFIDEAEIANSPVQQFSAVKPGDIKYKDQNEDGFINEFDVVPMGYNTAVPEAYFSFALGAEYKGLGFDALFQGAANYSAVLNTKSVYRPLVDNTSISNHYYENRWTPANVFAKYPRLTTESNDNNYRNNSIWIADASFLKLRTIELYYKVPKSVLENLRMKSAKLYVRGMDLFSIDGIDISDPEVIGVSYPTSKSINIGVAIGL